ncbi:predicted protein [Botrytis cinerea T4]|uniref:Uncharacterized protein n=1 Tax=Botryotinia fuckeliana (strain T4) TaxID=999810 RepID=G2Y0U5_BOTF4|nr:predicted protein [Botrytis cinerea T4]
MCHCMYFLFVKYDDENVRNVWKTEDLASAMSLHQDLTIDFLNLMRSHSPDIDPSDPRSLPDCVFSLPWKGRALFPATKLRALRLREELCGISYVSILQFITNEYF